jgi:hypothetical protein
MWIDCQIQKRLSLSNRAGDKDMMICREILGNYFFANKNYGRVTDLSLHKDSQGAKISLF